MLEMKALDKLVKLGLLPAEPEDEGSGFVLLYVSRTYGSASDGRTYSLALLGRPDQIREGHMLWTATGKNPRTPENVTWPEILGWLTTPSKSKWKIVRADSFTQIIDSKALNHELYRAPAPELKKTVKK